MKYRLLMIALLAVSFTGCYTSFSPRDYEEDSYGQISESYYGSPEAAEYIDSSEYFYPEEEYYEEPIQSVTVINNYAPDWGWGYSSPFYSSFYPAYGYYDYYYDPFYSPYYGPYYGGNIFVYGDAYFGGYYGGSSYYPSQVRYRANRNHWTSLRNSGKRNVSTSRSRGLAVSSGRTSKREPFTRDEFLTVKGIDLDKDLQVSRFASNGTSTNNSGLRTASISRSRDGNTKRVVKRTTDLDRRRILTNRNGEIRSTKYQSKQKVTQSKKTTKRVSKKSTSNKRSKRVYSSNRSSRSNNSSRSSSSSYYKPSRKTSSSSKVSSSTRNKRSSSSYSSSRNSSRSSSPSRSTVSRSSSSSSRSSASRSSSRSSSSSRSKSGSSSRRR